MSTSSALGDIDHNDQDFYDNIHSEIESDMARLKKSVIIVKKLRLTAAEMEVETAAMYHAELWRDIEELKELADKITIQDMN